MSNYDKAELKKFSEIAHQWWDSAGPCAPLHAINPLRLGFIKNQLELSGKNLIDVGCGGGILSESLAKSGATVTGIDMSADLIQTAKLHACAENLIIDYHRSTVEDFAEQRPAQHDALTCMEMLEHVPDPASVIHACALLVKPGGHLFFSTLNRNFKAYLAAIIGAEYLLQLLPKATHDYAKFIKPSELEKAARSAGLQLQKMTGLSYNPFTKNYSLCNDVSVNYIACFRKDDTEY